jgi:hypothetical protein
MSKSTGKPKGTAFVDFDSAAAAHAACSAAAAKQTEAGPGLTLRGKPLTVHAALVQDKARTLAAQLGGRVDSKHGRNLHLVRVPLVALILTCVRSLANQTCTLLNHADHFNYLCREYSQHVCRAKRGASSKDQNFGQNCLSVISRSDSQQPRRQAQSSKAPISSFHQLEYDC